MKVTKNRDLEQKTCNSATFNLKFKLKRKDDISKN